MFPSFSLLGVLERFSLPQPVAQHLLTIEPRLHEEFFRAVCYLLRTNRLEQLRTFALLVTDDRSPPPDRGNLTASELAFLQRKVEDEAQRETLVRLAPLLRGDFDLDEICWRGGIERAALEQLIHSHEDFLVTFSVGASSSSSGGNSAGNGGNGSSNSNGSGVAGGISTSA